MVGVKGGARNIASQVPAPARFSPAYQAILNRFAAELALQTIVEGCAGAAAPVFDSTRIARCAYAGRGRAYSADL